MPKCDNRISMDLTTFHTMRRRRRRIEIVLVGNARVKIYRRTRTVAGHKYLTAVGKALDHDRQRFAPKAFRLVIITEFPIRPADGAQQLGLHVGLPLQFTPHPFDAPLQDLLQEGRITAACDGWFDPAQHLLKQAGDFVLLRGLRLGLPFRLSRGSAGHVLTTAPATSSVISAVAVAITALCRRTNFPDRYNRLGAAALTGSCFRCR
jgi:hypothetical protein